MTRRFGEDNTDAWEQPDDQEEDTCETSSGEAEVSTEGMLTRELFDAFCEE